MKKPVKLLVYLLLSAVILFFLWARAECPRLTAQGALNRMESSNLAPKSRLISTDFLGNVNSNGTNYQRYMVAGVTDTHLHMSEIRKGAFLWHQPDRFYIPLTSFPLENAIAGLAPDQWPFDFSFFCYTTLPAQRWEAQLTVGSFVCTQEGQCDPGGFTLFSFDKLSKYTRYEELEPWIDDNLYARVHDMIGGGYSQDYQREDVTLEVVLYDSANGEIARVVKEYPAE